MQEERNRKELDVSIIVVSWNAKEFLRQCLQSIYETIHSVTYEIIVVDNDSSDGSPEMVKKEFPRVKLICTGDNFGFAKGNNIGINHSNGKYLFLINSDVEVKRGCINRMVSFMDKHPEIGLLGPKVQYPDVTLQPSCKSFPTLWNTACYALALDAILPRSKLFSSYLMRYWRHDKVRPIDVIAGCCWMVRREAVNEVGLLDEEFFMYGEDIDWCRRFWMAGWQVVFFPYAEVIHYGGASSSNASIRFYIEMLRANIQYFKKYHSRHAQIVFVLILVLHQVARIMGHSVMSIILRSERKTVIPKIRRSIAGVRWILTSSIWRREALLDTRMRGR